MLKNLRIIETDLKAESNLEFILKSIEDIEVPLDQALHSLKSLVKENKVIKRKESLKEL